MTRQPGQHGQPLQHGQPSAPDRRGGRRVVRFPVADLVNLRQDARLSVREVCEFLGRSRSTWKRWNRQGPPAWAVRALRLRAGYLDELGWIGWRLVRGLLVAPDLSRPFEMGDLYAAHWDRLRLLRRNCEGAQNGPQTADHGEDPSKL